MASLSHYLNAGTIVGSGASLGVGSKRSALEAFESACSNAYTRMNKPRLSSVSASEAPSKEMLSAASGMTILAALASADAGSPVNTPTPQSIKNVDQAIQFLSKGIYLDDVTLLNSKLQKFFDYCMELRASKNKKDIVRMGQAKAYATVLECVKRHQDNEEIQVSGFKLLVLLTLMYNELNGDLDTVETALLRAKSYSGNIYLQHRIMFFLGNLMTTRSVHKKKDAIQFAKRGGIAWLLEVMEQNPDEVDVQRGACHLLRNLCLSFPKLRKYINKSGGMSLASQAVENHEQNKEITKRGCEVVRMLLDAREGR